MAEQPRRRKRRRSNGTKDNEPPSPANDVPRIKGIPPSVTPVLLSAVKTRRKYLTRKSPKELECAEIASKDVEVTDSILDKLRRKENGGTGEEERLRKSSEDAARELFNAVRREALSSSRASQDGQEDANNMSTSVPVACLTFLLGIFADNGVKISTRHAALEISGELLMRSAECREMFAGADQMKQFVTVVGNLSKAMNDPRDDKNCEVSILVQSEAVGVLARLSLKFGCFYPRLAVATRYLEERKGVVICGSQKHSGGGRSSIGMIELRRARDMALKYGEKELKKVRKIIEKAGVSFDILVPRFGFGDERVNHSKSAGTIPENKCEIDWSDEDDVDWEEGDEEDICAHPGGGSGGTESGKDLAKQMNDPESHEFSVDQTIDFMKRSGATIGGGLEINFDDTEDEVLDHAQDKHEKVSSDKARTTLQKCVDTLFSRHVPRLAIWVDALTTADNMMSQDHNKSSQNPTASSSSLVVLPVKLRKIRGTTLSLLMDLKSDVARVLASAAKIGIFPNVVPPSPGERSGPQIQNSQPEHTQQREAPTSKMTQKPENSWKGALGIKPALCNPDGVKGRLMSRQGQHCAASPTNKAKVRIKMRK